MNKSEFSDKAKKVLMWIMPELAIIIGALAIDLISKAIVASTMELGQTVVIIPKLLNFSYTINTRAAFGSDFGLSKLFGEDGVMIFFIILTFAAVGFFGFLLFKKPKKGILYRIAFSLVIAGALGNLYDRMFLEGVRDFIQIEYLGLTIFGSTTFAIFNFADSCVVVGVILLIIFFIFFDKTLRENKPASVEGGETQNNENDASDESNDNITKLGEGEVSGGENTLVAAESSPEGQNLSGEVQEIVPEEAQLNGEEATVEQDKMSAENDENSASEADKSNQ